MLSDRSESAQRSRKENAEKKTLEELGQTSVTARQGAHCPLCRSEEQALPLIEGNPLQRSAALHRLCTRQGGRTMHAAPRLEAERVRIIPAAPQARTQVVQISENLSRGESRNLAEPRAPWRRGRCVLGPWLQPRPARGLILAGSILRLAATRKSRGFCAPAGVGSACSASGLPRVQRWPSAGAALLGAARCAPFCARRPTNCLPSAFSARAGLLVAWPWAFPNGAFAKSHTVSTSTRGSTQAQYGTRRCRHTASAPYSVC